MPEGPTTGGCGAGSSDSWGEGAKILVPEPSLGRIRYTDLPVPKKSGCSTGYMVPLPCGVALGFRGDGVLIRIGTPPVSALPSCSRASLDEMSERLERYRASNYEIFATVAALRVQVASLQGALRKQLWMEQDLSNQELKRKPYMVCPEVRAEKHADGGPTSFVGPLDSTPDKT